MANERILLILSNAETGEMLKRAVLEPMGVSVEFVTQWDAAENVVKKESYDLIILSDTLEGRDSFELAGKVFERDPFLPVITLIESQPEADVIEAFRRGFSDYLHLPIDTNNFQEVVSRALERRRKLQERIRLEARRDTKSLRQRVNSLETIHRIGRTVTSMLEPDSVLSAVVDAAVELTGAEEGSLLLLDEDSGELYMRASRNFQDEFANTFRLPIRDTLAGQVLRSGKPLLLDEKTPRKIKTSYLVYTIIYVPLIVQGRVIGVLEVDNRQSHNPFSDYHVTLVSALADYAAIAIENARLYSHSETERNQFENILTKIEEGVIVVDHDKRLLLMNRKARDTLGVNDQNISGKRIREVIQQQELLEVLKEAPPSTPTRVEISLEDGRVFNAQISPIAEIGIVATMQEITHLKELDRIKSDFVHTVSHDLRSPLTAILGYVELIDRVGPVNELQSEFIRRIQLSVHNITALINDLLDLGRIEAGFDLRNEIVPFSAIIHYAADGLKSRSAEKLQTLLLDIPEDLPHVLGNPIRLRQMVSNLIANAIKYTPESGKIEVLARSEDGQIILQVADNGPGIPTSDQPYIFDKFYRASNVSTDTPGTGLGLAIVKSIVENHLGRIWVDSTLGQGATFTVVLPTFDKEL